MPGGGFEFRVAAPHLALIGLRALANKLEERHRAQDATEAELRQLREYDELSQMLVAVAPNFADPLFMNVIAPELEKRFRSADRATQAGCSVAELLAPDGGAAGQK